MVWTYWELGADMCGTPSAARKKWLSKLIADLKLPKGTHAFWPVCLPEADADGGSVLRANPDVFWAGIRKLGARMLVVIGTDAAKAIGLPMTGNTFFLCSNYRGIHATLIQDFQQFMDSDNARRYDSIVTYLRRIGRTYVR